jgi:hypothetical protein
VAEVVESAPEAATETDDAVVETADEVVADEAPADEAPADEKAE